MKQLSFSEMNLKTGDGIDFQNSDDHFFERKLQELLFCIDGVPFWNEAGGRIAEFAVSLSCTVTSEFNKKKKKIVKQFWINRDTRFPDCDVCPDGWSLSSLESALDELLEQREYFDFLKRHDLFDDGRYLRNRNFQRVLYMDGRIEVIDAAKGRRE